MKTEVLSSSFNRLTDRPAPPWLGSRVAGPGFLARLVAGLVGVERVEAVADFVVEHLSEETQAESCSLMLLDPDSGRLEVIAAHGVREGTTLSDSVAPLKLGEGVAGWVASERRPLRLDNAAEDHRFVSRGGPGVVVNSLLSMPLTVSGRVVGVLNLSSPAPGVFSDADERLVASATSPIAATLERARKMELLEQENASLSEQMTECRTRLAQSEKMSAVGSLLAGIVHELNNPLTTILGFSQLLADGGGDHKKNLDRIVSETERCASIVQNVLKISRRGSDEAEVVNLNAAIRETLELAAYQLRLNHIGIGLHLTDRNPRISVNACEFTQVLLNLVTNAVQAISSARDEGTVDVTTSIDEDCVTVRVRDNGPGMDQDTAERVFEPFFTTKTAGTGLGLSLSRQLFETNGGRIEVASHPGEGTIFSIEFPLIEADSTGVAAGVETALRRVLVADDEHHILDLVEAILGSSFALDCVPSGEAALEKLRSGEYDLLISDLRMPGIGGRDLVQWIRDEGKDTRVMLLTGDVASKDIKEFISESDADCLAKPFRISELTEAVDRVFSDGADPGRNPMAGAL